MKQVTKRFLSIMLACVMLIGMLPVSAFAADTGSDETPTVPAESQEAVTEVTTTAPEESSSETAAVAPVASEPAEDESDVPEATVPAAAKSAAADPVQQLYDTLMAIHTYEELSDYMDNMTEEQYELLAQFSDDQNAALTAKITQLQEYEAEALPAGPNAPEPSNPTQPTTTAPEEDHTFTHLDVRIQDIKLTMTKRVINMVTGTVVSSNPITITANLTKVEYVTINGVTYNAFYKMSAREWRQSYVKINLSALTDSSTAVLVVDLVDKNGKTYNDVRITYNRAGIQYAIEHCDGYKANGGNIQYDGIDFDPAEGSNNITQIEYDDYVIPVLKIWDDAENQDGIRPSSVTVNLYANGELNDSAVLNANNNWQHMFTDKPSQDGSGNAISYTIDEASVPTGYTKVVGNNGTYLTVTNSHTPETIDISGSKTWDDNDDQDGKRPDSITVNLLADGEKVASKIVTEADGWAWSFTDLPKYADGSEIVYTVTEDAVADYTPEINGYNVTNTHEIEKTSVSGSKTWVDNDDQDGKRPETITINLLADGEVVDSVTVTEEDGWAWSFENLDKYANGSEIVYTVTEDAVADYTTEINGYNVTNTHEIEKTSVSGSKTWADNDNQDGKRPASITINLLADGEVVDSVTVTEEDGWAWSFDDLDKYANGKEIAYTITENAVADYSTTYDGYNVTNSHTPETIDLTVTKIWDDKDDQDGKRPDSITVNLLANGTKVATATITPDAEGNWTYTFAGYAKYADGEEIDYSVTEESVDEYASSVDGMLITNTHTPEKTSVSGSKTWADNNDQDGKRPETITINLLADGEVVDSVTVTEEDGWAWSFENLDKYANGEEIAYTITEDAVADYTTEINGYNVTNTHEIEKTSVSGSKTWVDNNDQDGKRPASITINLLADGEVVDSVTVTEEDGWAWSFENLDKYANGSEIVYTITEDAVEGYSAEIDGYNVTNTHEIEKTSVSVTKEWNDADNQDGKRPASVTVQLKADGAAQGDPVELSESNSWSYTFEDLDKYADGEEVIYTVEETDVPTGYEAEVTGNQAEGYTVTNTHEIEKISVSGSKTWVDNNDQDGVRPESITINLLADGEQIDSATVTATEGWEWSFTDLPKYRDQGTEIVYSIAEVAVDDYSTTYDGYNVTNTHIPEEIEISVTKVWDDAENQDGIRPNDITVVLNADGEKIASTVLSEGNDWTDAFTDLPKYRDQGIEIVYIVEEIEVDGYVSVITGTQAEGYTITNTHTPETVAVEGTKTWDDNDNQDGARPESITINLLKNGEVLESKTVTEVDGWVWSFTDLPKYENQGSEITYSITEVAVDDYSTTYDGYDVINTHTPEKTSVTVTKSWQDSNDQDGIRPDVITVILLANGEATEQTLELNADNNWTGSFTELDKFAAGEAITYTVAEVAVEGYETVISGDQTAGYVITNSYTPETVAVEGSKTWDDNDDQDGKRPASITINLLKDGEILESKTVTEADGWAWSFTELPKYENHGTEIVYAITENAVADYSTTYDGYNVTNSYTPEEISITVNKAWADSNNAEGIRPDSVTIKLLANGEDTGLTLTLSVEDKWTGSFTGLAKYADGVAIEYTIDEVSVKGYNTVIKGSVEEGFVVTNSHTYIPQTGDERTPIMWITMMAVSGMMIVLAVFDSKKKKRATK